MTDKTHEQIILPPRDIQVSEISTRNKHTIVNELEEQVLDKLEDIDFVARLIPLMIQFEKGLRDTEKHNFDIRDKTAKKLQNQKDVEQDDNQSIQDDEAARDALAKALAKVQRSAQASGSMAGSGQDT